MDVNFRRLAERYANDTQYHLQIRGQRAQEIEWRSGITNLIFVGSFMSIPFRFVLRNWIKLKKIIKLKGDLKMENTNNVISITDLINSQKKTRRTRTSQFTEYTSKKKLFESGVLTKEQQEQVSQIKNTFSFSLDNDNKYLIITLYNRNEEKKYSFFILNLASMTGIAADSIKKAKETVLEFLNMEVKDEVVEEVKEAAEEQVVVTEPIEEAKEAVEAVEQTEEVEEPKEKSTKRNKSRKTANK